MADRHAQSLSDLQEFLPSLQEFKTWPDPRLRFFATLGAVILIHSLILLLAFKVLIPRAKQFQEIQEIRQAKTNPKNVSWVDNSVTPALHDVLKTNSLVADPSKTRLPFATGPTPEKDPASQIALPTKPPTPEETSQPKPTPTPRTETPPAPKPRTTATFSLPKQTPPPPKPTPKSKPKPAPVPKLSAAPKPKPKPEPTAPRREATDKNPRRSEGTPQSPRASNEQDKPKPVPKLTPAPSLTAPPRKATDNSPKESEKQLTAAPAPTPTPAPKPAPAPAPAIAKPEVLSPNTPTHPATPATPGGARPTTTATPAGQHPSVLASYHQQIHDAFHRNWRQPAALPPRAESYQTKVKITIARDGTIVGTSLVKTSGHIIMDGSVLRAIQSVRQIAPLPNVIEGATYSVIINFQLD